MISAVRVATSKAERVRITAERADELVGGSWFGGYTSEVDLYEAAVTVDGFDAEARAEERDDTEFALFNGGLTVRGTLNLARDVHSIYVVRGALRARCMVLGDAVLVVDGPVTIDEWLFGDRTEGIFEVAGRQLESDGDGMLAHVQAPVVVLFDRGRREFVLREHGQRREIEHLVPDVIDDGEVDPNRIRARILAGQPVFQVAA
jgi:hypothetical protein